MAKTILQINEAAVFGKFLPTVQIESVEISRRVSDTGDDDADVANYENYATIKSDISIYVTIPSTVAESDIEATLFDSLGELRVYIVKSSYLGFFRNLEKNKLNLQDVFKSSTYGFTTSTCPWYEGDYLLKYEETKVSSSDKMSSSERNWLVYATANWRPYIRSYKISDLVDWGYYDSSTIFDEQGNRAVKISFSITNSFHNYYINRQSSLSVMAFAGTLAEPEEDSGTTITRQITQESPEAFQKRFGDIRYEEVLNYNNAPQSVIESYVYAENGTPYPGTPLQALNGTYRDSTDTTPEQLTDAVTNLIDQYVKFIDRDPTLKENMDQIQSIAATNATAPDLLPKLNTYRKLYSSKDPTTLSGKLYLGYESLISSFNSSILGKEEIKKQLFLNARVMDLRKEDYGVSYIPPGAPTLGLDRTGEDYIPTNWINYSRRTRAVVPSQGSMSDFLEFALEEGFMGTAAHDRLYDTTYESSPGLVRDDVLKGFGSTIEDAKRIFLEDYDESGVWGINSTDQLYLDTIVENRGIVFLEWEKALHTQSVLSKVLNIRRLKRWMNIDIPYEYFPVASSTMKRNEPIVRTQQGSGEDFEYVDIDRAAEAMGLTGAGYRYDLQVEITGEMRSSFLTDGINTAAWNRPETVETIHSIRPPRSLNDLDGGGLTHAQQWRRYGFPWVSLNTSTADIIAGAAVDGSSYSVNDIPYWLAESYLTGYSPSGGTGGYLGQVFGLRTFSKGSDYDSWSDQSDSRRAARIGMSDLGAYVTQMTHSPTIEDLDHISYSKFVFKNFDVMNTNPSDTLAHYNSPTGFSEQEGYRIMCFEFLDYMDDDVAYHNTQGFDEAHNFMAPTAAPDPSAYEFAFSVSDRTAAFYDVLHQMLRAEYDSFMKYYEYCLDKCSYDTFGDRFEEWFTEAAYQAFPEADSQPWIRAPFIFNMMRVVFFGEASFSDSGDVAETEANLNLSTLGWISKIAPTSGKMTYLRQFRFWFLNTLNLTMPNLYLSFQ